MRKLIVLLIVLFLVLTGLLQYRLWFGDGSIRELFQLRTDIEELKREGERRRERNAALDADVKDLKEGTDAIEERARQELGMVKQGETFVQVFKKPQPVAVELPPEDQKPKTGSEGPAPGKVGAVPAGPGPKRASKGLPAISEGRRKIPSVPHDGRR